MNKNKKILLSSNIIVQYRRLISGRCLESIWNFIILQIINAFEATIKFNGRLILLKCQYQRTQNILDLHIAFLRVDVVSLMSLYLLAICYFCLLQLSWRLNSNNSCQLGRCNYFNSRMAKIFDVLEFERDSIACWASWRSMKLWWLAACSCCPIWLRR